MKSNIILSLLIMSGVTQLQAMDEEMGLLRRISEMPGLVLESIGSNVPLDTILHLHNSHPEQLTELAAGQMVRRKIISFDGTAAHLQNTLAGIPNVLRYIQFDLRVNDEGDNSMQFIRWLGTSNRANGVIRLNLVLNQLTTLPPEISRLTNLHQLYLSHNNLATLPDPIRNLTNLQELYLNHNQLETLPDWIRNLTGLRRLNLYGNPLLDGEIARIRALLPATVQIDF